MTLTANLIKMMIVFFISYWLTFATELPNLIRALV